MADGSHRRGVKIMGIGEHRSLLEQPVQTRVIAIAKTQEVIVTELVNYNCQNELGLVKIVSLAPQQPGRSGEEG
jgi:hypothetical protein